MISTETSHPVLWLAGDDGGTGRLLRVEDRGEELAVTGDDFLNRDRSAIAFVGYMDVDREAVLRAAKVIAEIAAAL